MGKGKLYVLEGLDGSGKATQTALLTQALRAQGRQVLQISFPDYKSDSSALVRMYLAGEFGEHPDDVNAYAASSFYAVDRYASYCRHWGAFYRDGGTVIADRYTTSNAVHQCAKLPSAQRDAYLDWLFHYEYALLGLPVPDTVLYLRVEPSITERLIHERRQQTDIHERDRDYQRKSREAADYCAARFHWQTVECVRNGQMLPPEDIHRAIMARI